MMGHTHITIGAAVGLAVGVISQSTLTESLGLAAIAGLAAILPDIDHPQGQIRQKIGLAGDLSLFWLSHRGLTHTLLANALIGVLSYLLIPGLAQWAVMGGYTSHLAADALTRRGIPFFWPLSSRSIHVLPRPFRITSGGMIENILWMLLVVGIGYCLLRLIYGSP
jgi:inner membrane protein